MNISNEPAPHRSWAAVARIVTWLGATAGGLSATAFAGWPAVFLAGLVVLALAVLMCWMLRWIISNGTRTRRTIALITATRRR